MKKIEEFCANNSLILNLACGFTLGTIIPWAYWPIGLSLCLGTSLLVRHLGRRYEMRQL